MTEEQMPMELPDIPLPPEQEEEVTIKDECNCAWRIGIIGAGQAGSRVAESFYKLGYRRVCVVNTASQDLADIDIPQENKFLMDIGLGGAGKDPKKGKEAASKCHNDIYDLMVRCFGRDIDRVLVCIGAGGGTGTGSVLEIVEISREYLETLRIEGTNVGVIASLPKTGEGKLVNKNAHGVLTSLFRLVEEKAISPLVVIDNSKISELYPKLAVTKFWDTANRNISGLFHLFNDIATRDNGIVAFDRADLKSLLDSGIVTFGATPIKDVEADTAISKAVRGNLQKNVLVGDIDLTKASVAGCVFIGGQKVLDGMPEENLEHGFEQLSRILKGGNATVHRGVYTAAMKGLVVYTILGGLGVPEVRMKEIAKLGGVSDFYDE